MKTLLSLLMVCTIFQTIHGAEPKTLSIPTSIKDEQKEEQIICPICLDKFDTVTGILSAQAISVVCCGKIFHRECLDKWGASTSHWTCPTCKSGDKQLIIRQEVNCGICKKGYALEDKIIQVPCTESPNITKKTTDWVKGGRTSFFDIGYSIVGRAIGMEEAVVHCFHENCLRMYYATSKEGHDNNFGRITFFCPIHKDKPVDLPKSFTNIKLADKEEMTPEEVLAVVQREERRERQISLIRGMGGVAPLSDPRK